MALKVKKEAPAPLKVEARAKSSKAKNTVLKGIRSYQKRQSGVTYYSITQNSAAQEAAQISLEKQA